MVRNQQINDALHQLMNDPKVKIYAVVEGKMGFKLAQKMLNSADEGQWDEGQWDEGQWNEGEWASKWSEQEKRNAVFILFGKKIRVQEKIGIKLLIGDGDNFVGVGELHPKKKALKIWNLP
jgi:hypothetical protein